MGEASDTTTKKNNTRQGGLASAGIAGIGGAATLSQDRVDAVFNDFYSVSVGSGLAFPSPPDVTSYKPSNGYLSKFKPWWDINYQGLLFFFSQDSQPGIKLSIFALVSPGRPGISIYN